MSETNPRSAVNQFRETLISLINMEQKTIKLNRIPFLFQLCYFIKNYPQYCFEWTIGQTMYKYSVVFDYANVNIIHLS